MFLSLYCFSYLVLFSMPVGFLHLGVQGLGGNTLSLMQPPAWSVLFTLARLSVSAQLHFYLIVSVYVWGFSISLLQQTDKIFYLCFKRTSKVNAEPQYAVLGKQWYTCFPTNAKCWHIWYQCTLCTPSRLAFKKLLIIRSLEQLVLGLSFLLFVPCRAHSRLVLFFKDTLSYAGVMRDLIILQYQEAYVTVSMDQL